MFLPAVPSFLEPLPWVFYCTLSIIVSVVETISLRLLSQCRYHPETLYQIVHDIRQNVLPHMNVYQLFQDALYGDLWYNILSIPFLVWLSVSNIAIVCIVLFRAIMSLVFPDHLLAQYVRDQDIVRQLFG
jgi:hypothetical protein